MTKCDCVPGHFLCSEAVRLWDKVNAAYHEHNDNGYELAKQAYDKHIDEVEL